MTQFPLLRICLLCCAESKIDKLHCANVCAFVYYSNRFVKLNLYSFVENESLAHKLSRTLVIFACTLFHSNIRYHMRKWTCDNLKQMLFGVLKTQQRNNIKSKAKWNEAAASGTEDEEIGSCNGFAIVALTCMRKKRDDSDKEQYRERVLNATPNIVASSSSHRTYIHEIPQSKIKPTMRFNAVLWPRTLVKLSKKEKHKHVHRHNFWRNKNQNKNKEKQKLNVI